MTSGNQDGVRLQVSSIVVGIDGSPPSNAGLEWALRIAAMNDAQIEAVMAWHLPTLWFGTAPTPDWNPAEDASRALESTVQQVAGEAADRVSLHIAEGYPAQVLIDAAEDADLLIVGNRGHGGIGGMTLGATSNACVQHAKCPVLVVR